MNDLNNRSDHMAINILTEHNQRINGPLKVNNDYIPKFVLNSKAFQIKFNNALRLELAESLHLAKKLNLMEPKNKQNNIKIILDNISNIILKTVKTSAEQYRSPLKHFNISNQKCGGMTNVNNYMTINMNSLKSGQETQSLKERSKSLITK